ncbi:glycosyltransferase family 2 protein [Chitinophaga rhizophila]|uniref:Glycosyltransferase n=1 Tax=Chitinophaga rhizophila TaxID=2866212 RepID=A0ABS7G527_9BACT|nr:glycosyltransferase [Chitinophaga rhizophila]MBW8682759.1 glycosyltransferase [Chitinophaga rhizophila]
MEKKISVVIPTYQRPELLSRCLKALEEQQFDPGAFEVIVVSDGPDKYTRQIAASWKYAGLIDVKYYALPAKKGPAAARNAGWRLSQSPFIAFTDDDTQPDPFWLQNLWKGWKGQAAVVYTGRVVVPINGRPTDYEWNTAQLEKADFVTANCACTRQALEMVNGFDESFEAAWREDSDLEFRLLQQNIPIYHLQNAVVVHPVRKASWGVSIKEQKKNIFNALLYKKFPQLYRTRIQKNPAWNYYVMIACFATGIVSLGYGQPTVAAVLFGAWLLLIGIFAEKRLRHTSRSISHVLEMIVTSAAIPFAATYWTLYGAWRYKVLYL